MTIDERAFFVIVEDDRGRMRPCSKDHQHATREEADACAAERRGVAVLEWVRDRRPQFDMVWVRDDVAGDSREVLNLFKERLN